MAFMVEHMETVRQPPPPAAAASFSARSAKLLFFAHLLAFGALVVFLSVRGFNHRQPAFRPVHWFGPLLASVAASLLAAAAFLLLALHHPRFALKASRFLAPLLNLGAAVLLVAIGTAGSLGFGIIGLVVTIAQAIYACWISPRLPHAYELLEAAVPDAKVPRAATAYVGLALLVGTAYSALWVIGTVGLAADRHSPFAPLYVLALLLSLAWTMQVIKYLVLVAVARIAHGQFTFGVAGRAREAFGGAARAALGEVCFAAAVAPAVTAARGGARAMDIVAGGVDEFLFSCANCYMGVADWMVSRCNRWGLVLVGAYWWGFATASGHAWDTFGKQGMRRLLDADLTSSFCFFCGVAGGSAAAVVAGSWVVHVEKRLATEATVYAFFLGYFLVRIAMAWPQACVAAFHVAYAENPYNPCLGSCIQRRIGELNQTRD